MSRFHRYVTTPPGRWVPGYEEAAFSGVGLLCDFSHFDGYTGLGFYVRNTGGDAIVFVPEMSVDGVNVTLFENGAPFAVTVPAGESRISTYGIDLMLPYCRIMITSGTSGTWGIRGLPRF